MTGPVPEGVRVTTKTANDGKSTYEEIEPLVPLASKVVLGHGIDAAMLAEADAVMATMAVDFHLWAAEDLGRLRAAASELRRTGAAPQATAVQRLAHDLKGQGGSFGYPLVTLVAGSLCRLLAGRQQFDNRVHAAIEAHLKALAMVVSGKLSGEQTALAGRLQEEMSRLVAHLVAAAAQP